MRENRTPGSVRGLVGNGESYLNGNYELDYWCLANREALENRDQWAPPIENHRYRIHISGLAEVTELLLPDDMEIVPIGAGRADFFVATTSMQAHTYLEGEVVFVIERAGLPILVIRKLP